MATLLQPDAIPRDGADSLRGPSLKHTGMKVK
jgi:hypothetical protein